MNILSVLESEEMARHERDANRMRRRAAAKYRVWLLSAGLWRDGGVWLDAEAWAD